MLGGPAFAGDDNTNINKNSSTSSSNSGAVSGSQSRSSSVSRGGAGGNAQSGAANAGNAQAITFNSPGNTTANNRDNINYSGGTSSYSSSNNWQGGDQTIRSAPTVYAPPVSGGNPCTLAVSGGISVIGWGAAAGGTFVDQDCANRQKIAMIHNAGYGAAAKELMCNDRDTYFAFRTAGAPCAFRPTFEGQAQQPPAPLVQQAPVVPATAPQPVRVVAPQQPLRRCTGPNDQGPCYSG